MRLALVLAITASVALVVALFSGSTVAAVVVVLLAVAGIVVLLREWRAGTEPAAAPPTAPEFSADDLSPDVSTSPDGPSSDARADQL